MNLNFILSPQHCPVSKISLQVSSLPAPVPCWASWCLSVCTHSYESAHKSLGNFDLDLGWGARFTLKPLPNPSILAVLNPNLSLLCFIRQLFSFSQHLVWKKCPQGESQGECGVTFAFPPVKLCSPTAIAVECLRMVILYISSF